MSLRTTFVSRSAAALMVVLLVASAAGGHAQAVKSGSAPPPDLSRVDIYGGYGYIHPVNSDINNYEYQPINLGSVVSIAGYFNRHLGVQAEGSFFPHGPNDCIYSAQAGPIFRFQRGRFAPFVHALAGGARVGGPAFQPCSWGWGVTSGIGLDYITPFLNNHLALRPIQADFDFSDVNYGPLVEPGGVSGGAGKITAYRLSSGIVLRLGSTPNPYPAQLGCTVQPADAYPGDIVTATAVAANVNPRKHINYTWTSSGGKVTGSDETATVATASLPPGDYTITGHIAEGRGHQATCNVGFRVHTYEPPTLSCSANPSTLLSGQSSTITAAGRSPQNRPLTYAYTASSGQINGSGSTVTLTTSAATTGTIEVTCNTIDDLGHQASASTSISISTPPPPPVPQPRPLCSVYFDRDSKRPVRVNNEGKACLDDIALTLLRDPEAKLVVVGHHDSSEKPEAAAQRALNVAQYLTDEKSIDMGRIELRTGEATGRMVEDTLVPAGATFNSGSTATFDVNSVQRYGQAYGKPDSDKSKKIR